MLPRWPCSFLPLSGRSGSLWGHSCRSKQHYLCHRSKAVLSSPSSPCLSAASAALDEIRDVRIVEVGPRDGLQNEKQIIDTQSKVSFINMLSDAGLKTIEATAFVSPKWVPQMGDHREVLSLIRRREGTSYPVLVPNVKGYEAARDAGATEVAVFAAASETFSKKNTNCSIRESSERFKPLLKMAREDNIRVRGYVSCIFTCPYEGRTPTSKVVEVVEDLLDLGCYEISLGDTTGMGTARDVKTLIRALRDSAGIATSSLAFHGHDTYGQALANILMALEEGISVIDSSVGGLGGCPYSKGATGNVATEEVLYLLNGLGVATDVDMSKLLMAEAFISTILNKTRRSRLAEAMQAIKDDSNR